MRLRGLVGAVLAVLLSGGVAAGFVRSPTARRSSDPVVRAVADAEARHAVNPLQAAIYRSIYRAAMADALRLSGPRAAELRSAIGVVRGIAARRVLSPSRMTLVFLTLLRNAQWWSTHGPPSPSSGGEPAAQGRVCKPLTEARARVANMTFPGSGIVYEYYPGLGLQLQVNATFGSVNGLLTEGSHRAVARAGAILDEMLPLASDRQGRLTWEYEFPFEGARPPWTSGLSQATAIEALTRGAVALARPAYLAVALRLAHLFATPPPTGVRVRAAGGGDWFLLYSFAPDQIVLNADLDALIALHDLGAATHAPLVTALERSGLRALERNIGRFDTGTWSLYAEGGPLADLNYQALNLELAQKLCQRTGVPSICRAGRSFGRELNARCPLVKHQADRPRGGRGTATLA